MNVKKLFASRRKQRGNLARNSLIFFTVALLVFIIDQSSKSWIVLHMDHGESRALLGKVLYLTHVRNPGAAFGLFAGQTSFFIVISFVMIILIVLAAFLVPPGFLTLRLGLAVLLGGVAGNLYDRLLTGLVVDFLDLRFWPVFNLADVAVVVGAFLLAAGLISRSPKENSAQGGSEGG